MATLHFTQHAHNFVTELQIDKMESDHVVYVHVHNISIQHLYLEKRTIGRLLEVDVRITEGTPSDHVPAYSDWEDRPGRAEFLVQHGLRDVLMQVSHVQRGHGVTGRAGIHDWWCAFSVTRKLDKISTADTITIALDMD